MITEKDLQEAIAECQGQRNPNANTCIKLAAFLTIQREMFGDHAVEMPVYSYSSAPVEYDKDSEIVSLLNGRDFNEVIPLLDELLSTLQIVNKGLYDGFIRRMKK